MSCTLLKVKMTFDYDTFSCSFYQRDAVVEQLTE